VLSKGANPFIAFNWQAKSGFNALRQSVMQGVDYLVTESSPQSPPHQLNIADYAGAANMSPQPPYCLVSKHVSTTSTIIGWWMMYCAACRRVAIEVFDASCFCGNQQQPLGETVMRIQLLGACGWQVRGALPGGNRQTLCRIVAHRLLLVCRASVIL
jgi:hypothetical protein